MTYHIGQQVPLDYTRSIVGSVMRGAEWYALRVPFGKESSVREALRIRGIHSCFPERETSYKARGKKITRKFPIITRIVYAKFTREPQFDVLKARRLITGVFSYGDRPIIIPGDVIRGVMGLPTEAERLAERLAEARRQLLMVRDGDRANLTVGPLSGVLVDVTEVKEGRVWFETLTGIKGSTTTEGVERIIPVERPEAMR